jgi:non-ribosomal peptide synthetase component E (peptide arylation enzyme)
VHSAAAVRASCDRAKVNRRGHRRRSGRPWSFKTVTDTLVNPANIGTVAFRDVQAEDAHPAIIDREVFVLLSGGTTGSPKIIARTHDDYGYSVRCSAEAGGYDGGTVFLAALPMAHGLTLGGPGVLGVLGVLAVCGRLVIARSPNPDAAFARRRPFQSWVWPPLSS